MSIEELTSLVKPPTAPRGVPSCSEYWARIESELGVGLPSDYTEFITIYGEGVLGNLINVLSPFSELEGGSLVTRARAESKRLVDMSDEPEYGIWPDSPGLLNWGNDGIMNVYFWYTEGEPDEWPVVVDAAHCDFEKIAMPMTVFLAKGLRGEFRSAHWPDEWPRENSLVFRPFN